MQLSEDMDYRVKISVLDVCYLFVSYYRKQPGVLKSKEAISISQFLIIAASKILLLKKLYTSGTEHREISTELSRTLMISFHLNWKVQCKLIGMKRYQLSYPVLEPDYYNTDLPGDLYTLVQCWYDCLWRQPPTILIGLHISMHKRKFIPSTPNFVKTKGQRSHRPQVRIYYCCFDKWSYCLYT